MPNSPSQVTKTNRLHIKSLTSLRFIAAFGIFILHASTHDLVSLEHISFLDLSKSVSFFFVLSGFVLSYAYDNSSINIRSFYFSRFFRLWPVTFVSLDFTLLLLPRGYYLPTQSSFFPDTLVFIVHILCLQSIIPISSFYFSFNAVAWSISAEFIFYLLFPYVLPCKLRHIMALVILNLLFLLLCSFVLNFFDLEYFSSSNYDLFDLNGFLYINPVARFPEFLVGILAFKIYSLPIFSKFISQLALMRLRSRPLFALTENIILLLIFYFAFSPQFLPLSSCPKSLEIVLLHLKSASFFALGILYFASFDSPISRILSGRLFVFLGQISFSFYLFHQPIMIRAAQLEGVNLFGISFLYPHFFCVVLSLLFSVLAYFLVEKKFSNLYQAFRSNA